MTNQLYHIQNKETNSFINKPTNHPKKKGKNKYKKEISSLFPRLPGCRWWYNFLATTTTTTHRLAIHLPSIIRVPQFIALAGVISGRGIGSFTRPLFRRGVNTGLRYGADRQVGEWPRMRFRSGTIIFSFFLFFSHFLSSFFLFHPIPENCEPSSFHLDLPLPYHRVTLP